MRYWNDSFFSGLSDIALRVDITTSKRLGWTVVSDMTGRHDNQGGTAFLIFRLSLAESSCRVRLWSSSAVPTRSGLVGSLMSGKQQKPMSLANQDLQFDEPCSPAWLGYPAYVARTPSLERLPDCFHRSSPLR